MFNKTVTWLRYVLPNMLNNTEFVETNVTHYNSISITVNLNMH